jgi:hypothetical protein
MVNQQAPEAVGWEHNLGTILKDSGGSAADYDCLVSTSCIDCFIRITGYKEDWKDGCAVFISMFTSHANNDQMPLWWRIKRACRILRGRRDADYDIVSIKEIDNLVEALQECKKAVI